MFAWDALLYFLYVMSRKDYFFVDLQNINVPNPLDVEKKLGFSCNKLRTARGGVTKRIKFSDFIQDGGLCKK